MEFYRAECPSCYSTISVKALKGTQGTHPNQWPGLILSCSACSKHMQAFCVLNLLRLNQIDDIYNCRCALAKREKSLSSEFWPRFWRTVRLCFGDTQNPLLTQCRISQGKPLCQNQLNSFSCFDKFHLYGWTVIMP